MLILQREREARGWSRLELARQARLASGDVGQIEKGRILPFPNQLERLHGVLSHEGDPAELLEEAPDE